MNILKRIDFVQQFAKEYADGSWSIETDHWKHHVTPEFVEDVRQYIESLQLKLMRIQTAQAQQPVAWRVWNGGLQGDGNVYLYSEDGGGEPLYTSPPPSDVPLLTAAEILAIMRGGNNCNYNDEGEHVDFARTVEQAVRVKAGLK